MTQRVQSRCYRMASNLTAHIVFSRRTVWLVFMVRIDWS